MLDKALCIPNGNWLPNEMADAPRTDGFEWAAAAIPTLEAGQTPYFNMIVDGFGVMEKAANKELAKEFVRYMYTDAAQLAMAESTIVTCTKNFADIAGDLLTADQLAFLAIRDEAAAISFNFAAHNAPVVVNDYFWGVYTDVVNGDMSAEEWVAGLKDALQQCKDSL